MKLVGSIAVSLMAAASLVGTSAHAAEWPERAVRIVVVAGAGGGADYTMRLLGHELEKEFDQPFNIVNQAQASGIAGYTTYTQANPEGYTLGQLSPIAQFKILGQADFTPSDFTPIAQFNSDPAAINVSTDSEFENLEQIVEALKEDPAGYRISCGGTCNASWDLPFVQMLMDQGVDVGQLNLIPAQGSAAALQELSAGGIDIVLCSLPETISLKDAGVVQNVAVMSQERLESFPDVPTATEELGETYVGGTWRGLAGPAGMDAALVSRIEQGVKQAIESPEFIEGMEARGFGITWRNSEEFAEFLEQHYVDTEEAMAALGSGG